MMERHKDCRSCCLDYEGCAFFGEDIAESCPCLLCLTKPICDKSDCSLRERLYYETIGRGKKLPRL